MDTSTIITLLGVAVLMYLYMKERGDHTNTKNELAILKRMGELSELGQKLQDEHNAYDQSLQAFTDIDIPDHMLDSIIHDLPPGPLQDSTPTSAPRFFRGQATEDIREGQSVEVEVREDLGKTLVKGATPTTPRTPIGES